MKQTALITGASSGIGSELAKLFAKAQINLVLVARRRERLDILAAGLIKKHGITVEVIDSDLTDADKRQQIFDRLKEKNISIDYLINNAGFGDNGPFIDCDWDKQQRMIELNISALSHLTRLFLPQLIQQKRGGILNVASTAGFLPGPNMAVYYASKAYVLSFTEAIAQEVKASGIKVSALCPGPVKTEFVAVAGIENAKMVNPLTTLSAQKVALIGYRGLMRGKVVNISGLIMKIMIHSLRISPRAMTRKLSAWMARTH